MCLDGHLRSLVMINCAHKNCKLDEKKNLKDLSDEAYKIFKEFLTDDTLVFRGKKILFKTEKDFFTFRELGFEHIVSMEDKKTRIRIYDKNRLIYLPFIKKIINNCCNGSCTDIKIFKDKADICIWCKSSDFVIILNKRENGFLLLTAYPVIYNHKRSSLEKKANENDSY